MSDEKADLQYVVEQIEIPSKLIFSCIHAAKAMEEALNAKSKGVSLRNFQFEVIRRLTMRKQAKDVESLLKDIGNEEKIYLIVTKKPIGVNLKCKFCPLDSFMYIFGKRFEGKSEDIEKKLVSLIALTSIDKWDRDMSV
ncbi:hypothetical protein IOK49_05830 [Fervidicoccus fontis]|jgi:hypothetical protein|uniref:Uncharacterized protein n=2 Tax=Fervidicoccus fontis TaxID=683846 RepID=I0A1E2_FERFK|nr:hypothetical protein [Fervidicoccus fontis]AFH42799.1 hypothetical protein FFONT_0811 [Fervidicoccus fontis Kam940]MBE9391585.1 hypothetical protein [Fervidicoccus fontis]PMB76867.1 MAG: hypothetical protein C0177_04870 [Fervidicoccus fontis]HEW64148.1 hypothetical protein [Fervidicoccus fontis]